MFTSVLLRMVMVINIDILKVEIMKVYSYVDMTRANADGAYAVYIIVSNSKGRFFVNTGMTTCGRLTSGCVFPKEDVSGGRKTRLLGKYMAQVEAVCLRQAIADVDNKSLKAVIQKEVFGVEYGKREKTLADFIDDFSLLKREQTCGIYKNTARKVREYAVKKKCVLDSVDAVWLESFRQWCMSNGMSVNGAGKELRNIRAVFNWAVRSGVTRNYPFVSYSIPEEETVPNNICAEDLRRLRDYPCEPWQRPYVDFFFLSFYLAGINPVDLLSLKADAVKDGHITFVRRKTDKQGSSRIRKVTVPVVREAQKIIDRYPSREGWLLGFMDSRSSYRSFARVCNDALRKVGRSWKVKDKAGKLRKMAYEPVCPGITLYSARYSFGSIAVNDLDISEQTVGMCLGHSWSKNVTARYIAHDQKKIDNAVRKVVDYVVRGAE